MSVNDFYWFGVENGDTARGNESVVVLFFSSFSIANLRNSENATATFLKVCMIIILCYVLINVLILIDSFWQYPRVIN